jgi:hypothetical protein
MWAVIHLSALNYEKSVDSEEEYTNFYRSLCSTLGCKDCMVHYKQFMIDNPPDFNDLFGWTVDLHNSINEMRGESTYTRQSSLDFWLS